MNNTSVRILALIVSAGLALGCAEENVNPGVESSVGGKGDDVATEWRTRIVKESDALASQDPHRYRTLKDLEAIPTRPGFLRLRGEAIHTPAAASVFLSRFMGESDARIRAALIEALPRTSGIFEDAVTELLDSERDEGVRTAMIAALGRGTSAALSGLEKGLGDQALSVRLEAVVAVARHEQGGAFAVTLEGMLGDSSTKVRAAAARALGIHKISAAEPAISARLSDSDPEVRLQSLRALARIDAEKLQANPELARLVNDEDSRIGTAARRLLKADR